jgi:hypothetical protein
MYSNLIWYLRGSQGELAAIRKLSTHHILLHHQLLLKIHPKQYKQQQHPLENTPNKQLEPMYIWHYRQLDNPSYKPQEMTKHNQLNELNRSDELHMHTEQAALALEEYHDDIVHAFQLAKSPMLWTQPTWQMQRNVRTGQTGKRQ